MATLKTDNVDSTSGGNVKFIKNLDVGDGSTAKNAHVYGTLEVGGATTLGANLGMGSHDITCGDVTASGTGAFNALTVGGVAVNVGAIAQGVVLLDKKGSTSTFQSSTVDFPADGSGSGEIDYSDYTDFTLNVKDFISSDAWSRSYVSWQIKIGSTWYTLGQWSSNLRANTGTTSGEMRTVGKHLATVGKFEHPSYNTYAYQGGTTTTWVAGNDLSHTIEVSYPDGAITGMRLLYGANSWKGLFRLYGTIAETS